ncbi:MAG: ribosomal-processing cysteine protease Prp [Clostridia bacterium]|nr:ribosomal-processing cysteine protease Prp [Clostridia bacterium]
MTKIRFLKSDGVFYGFEEEGHAGFSEAGTDIICSAISAMTMLVINTIEVAVGSDVEYSIDDDTTNIKVLAKGALEKFESDEKKRFAVASVLMGYYLQLNDMLEDYYEFIDVEEEERPV